jgi:hypothetical protein
MFDTAKLERVALALDRAADVAKAKMQQHLTHGEGADASKEATRSARMIGFAADVREAIKELTRRNRISHGQSNRPEWEEALAYAKEIGFPEAQLRTWYDHFESNGWKVGKARTPMKDWRAAIRNGKAGWIRDRSGTPAKSTMSATVDPPGWRDFLSGRKIPFVDFTSAMPYLRDDFRKQRNGRRT